MAEIDLNLVEIKTSAATRALKEIYRQIREKFRVLDPYEIGIEYGLVDKDMNLYIAVDVSGMRFKSEAIAKEDWR